MHQQGRLFVATPKKENLVVLKELIEAGTVTPVIDRTYPLKDFPEAFRVTPLEPGWRGKLTLELANLSPLPIRLHIHQGITQVVFFQGRRPLRTYAEKETGATYQDQQGVTLPR